MTSMLLRSALAALLLTCCLLPSPARADDKTFSGVSCRPYGTDTTADDLVYVINGVTTRAATHETVICDIPVDTETVWRGTATGTLAIVFRGGGTASTVNCTALVGSGLMWGWNAYGSGSVSLPANTMVTAALGSMTAPDAYAWAPVSVVCSLPPNATLIRIVLHETGAT